MAASAPIQFTVDQEQLKVADTNVARSTPGPKKRTHPSNSYSSPSAVTRPAYPQQSPPTNGTSMNRVLSMASTQNNKIASSKAVEGAPFKADTEEGESPKLLTTEPPVGTPQNDEELLEPKKKQEEDLEDTSNDREGDIYADKVLQCKSLLPHFHDGLTHGINKFNR
jgi:ribonucleoside-diphosphate reductase subunit M1